MRNEANQDMLNDSDEREGQSSSSSHSNDVHHDVYMDEGDVVWTKQTLCVTSFTN